MAKKKGKRGRPRSQKLQRCPKCGKPGFPKEKFVRRGDKKFGPYLMYGHYSSQKYKANPRQGAHLLGDPMTWCHISSGKGRKKKEAA